MAQFLRPDSLVSAGSWTGSNTSIDEATADDGDFAYSQDNPNGSIFEVGLSDPVSPGAGTYTVRYRHAQVRSGVLNGTGTATALVVSVYQGTTLIANDAQQDPGSLWTTRTWMPDLSGVTDWTGLRLRFVATGGGGSPSNRRGVAVSWAEIEVPDAAAPPVTGAGGALPIGISLTAPVADAVSAHSIPSVGGVGGLNAPNLYMAQPAVAASAGYSVDVVGGVGAGQALLELSAAADLSGILTLSAVDGTSALTASITMDQPSASGGGTLASQSVSGSASLAAGDVAISAPSANSDATFQALPIDGNGAFLAPDIALQQPLFTGGGGYSADIVAGTISASGSLLLGVGVAGAASFEASGVLGAATATGNIILYGAASGVGGLVSTDPVIGHSSLSSSIALGSFIEANAFQGIGSKGRKAKPKGSANSVTLRVKNDRRAKMLSRWNGVRNV